MDPFAAAKKIPAASVTLKQACDVSVSDGKRSEMPTEGMPVQQLLRLRKERGSGKLGKKGKRTRKKRANNALIASEKGWTVGAAAAWVAKR